MNPALARHMSAAVLDGEAPFIEVRWWVISPPWPTKVPPRGLGIAAGSRRHRDKEEEQDQDHQGPAAVAGVAGAAELIGRRQGDVGLRRAGGTLDRTGRGRRGVGTTTVA